MQWLNKIDDVLDQALSTPPRRAGQQMGDSSSSSNSSSADTSEAVNETTTMDEYYEEGEVGEEELFVGQRTPEREVSPIFNRLNHNPPPVRTSVISSATSSSSSPAGRTMIRASEQFTTTPNRRSDPLQQRVTPGHLKRRPLLRRRQDDNDSDSDQDDNKEEESSPQSLLQPIPRTEVTATATIEASSLSVVEKSVTPPPIIKKKQVEEPKSTIQKTSVTDDATIPFKRTESSEDHRRDDYPRSDNIITKKTTTRESSSLLPLSEEDRKGKQVSPATTTTSTEPSGGADDDEEEGDVIVSSQQEKEEVDSTEASFLANLLAVSPKSQKDNDKASEESSSSSSESDEEEEAFQDVDLSTPTPTPLSTTSGSGSGSGSSNKAEKVASSENGATSDGATTEETFQETTTVATTEDMGAAAAALSARTRDGRIDPLLPPSTTEASLGEEEKEEEEQLSVTHQSPLPQLVEYRSEFDVDELFTSWKCLDGDPLYESRMNCYGVVHVRILRAQRLSCSVGSNVEAVVSLKPWKGKVRTTKAKSFYGPLDHHGVCVQWDEEETEPLSMVHAYSSEESPVPSIHIEMVFNPLGVFDFTMCSLTLSCEALLSSPLSPRRQWFAATVDGNNQDVDNDKVPIIEVEAMFEPVDESPQNIDEGGGAPVEMIEVVSQHISDASLSEEATTQPLPNNKRASLSSMKTDERSQAEVSLSLQSSFREGKPVPTKPHLLRAVTYWKPAKCGVCRRSIMTGPWKKGAYRCEVCLLDCCSDCRLQVDVQLPCGSDLAEEVRAKLVQNKLTMDNILNVVAPMEETQVEELESHSTHKVERQPSVYSRAVSFSRMETMDEEQGIGTMKLDFIGARVFEKSFPAETSPEELNREDRSLREGDYYVRISWSGSPATKRTKTVQNTGRPKFESGEMRFTVPHYGTEFRIELIDASSDKPMGTTFIPIQSLLQQQRDILVERHGISFTTFLRGPVKFEGKRRLLLELRTGVKTSADFFAPTKTPSSTEGPRPGDIIGLVEVMAGMEEDLENLFGRTPYECPPRSTEELNLAMFQVHLNRLSSLIDDVKYAVGVYMYVVGWKNPLVTGLSLMLFIRLWMRFNPAYIGSLPLSLLLLFMLYLATARRFGRLKKRFMRKEAVEYRKEQKVVVDYSLHRPAGLLKVNVERGRNIRSPELGLPGSVRCRVYWDPTRFLSEKNRKAAIKVDKAASSTHEIGTTRHLYSTSPNWERIAQSPEAKRLKQLLPKSSDGSFFEAPTDTETNGTKFPVLQPFRMHGGDTETLDSWKNSVGAVVFEVKFQDAMGLLPGSEYTLGEVAIPLSSISESGVISGWYQVLDAGTTRVVRGTDPENGGSAETDDAHDAPQIFLRIEWSAPEKQPQEASETQIEASLVIQEEMIRSALADSKHKLSLESLVGTSVGAFNTVRGLSENLLLVQNTLSSILDFVGSARNAFNFTDPFKSMVLLLTVFLLWLFLAFVPTGWLILAGGLAQYIITFVQRFGWMLTPSKSASAASPEVNRNKDAGPFVAWFLNAIRGIPTDEDLRKAYFWECRRFQARETEKQAKERLERRLSTLWKSTWYSSIQILSPSADGQHCEKLKSFAVIQGHWFLWWPSVDDFDKGEEPTGRIFLAGHAGLATPSPIELKVTDKEDLPRLASIFGRGAEGPERLTFLLPSLEVKLKLEDAVVFASSSSKND